MEAMLLRKVRLSPYFSLTTEKNVQFTITAAKVSNPKCVSWTVLYPPLLNEVWHYEVFLSYLSVMTYCRGCTWPVLLRHCGACPFRSPFPSQFRSRVNTGGTMAVCWVATRCKVSTLKIIRMAWTYRAFINKRPSLHCLKLLTAPLNKLDIIILHSILYLCRSWAQQTVANYWARINWKRQ